MSRSNHSLSLGSRSMFLLLLKFFPGCILVIFIRICYLLLAMNSVTEGTHPTRVCTQCPVQCPARNTRNNKLLQTNGPAQWSLRCSLPNSQHPEKRRLRWQQPPRSYGLKLQIISIIIVTFHLLITLSLFRKTRLSFPFLNCISTWKVRFFWNLFFFFSRLNTSLLGTHRKHRRKESILLYVRRHYFQTYNSPKIKQNRKYEGKILCQKPFKDK